MAITTTANYILHNPGAAGINSTVLTAYLSASVRAMERYCGRSIGGFESASVTEDFLGNGNPTYVLRNTPATAITSVSVIANDGTATALDSTSYRVVDATRGVLQRTSGTWFGDETSLAASSYRYSRPSSAWVLDTHYRVVYTGGFRASEEAEDLDLLEVIVWRLMDLLVADAGRGGLQSENLGSYSYTLLAASETMARERALIAPYARMVGN